MIARHLRAIAGPLALAIWVGTATVAACSLLTPLAAGAPFILAAGNAAGWLP